MYYFYFFRGIQKTGLKDDVDFQSVQGVIELGLKKLKPINDFSLVLSSRYVYLYLYSLSIMYKCIINNFTSQMFIHSLFLPSWNHLNLNLILYCV